MAAENVTTETTVVEETPLVEFNWDENSDGIFTPPVVKTKAQKQEEVINKVKTTEVEIENEDEPESEHKFFEDQETENTKGDEGEDTKGKKPEKGNDVVPPKKKTTTTTSDETPEDEPEEGDKFFKTLALEMKEKNIFTSLEINEDDEIDEDKFFELQEQEIQARVDETFTGIFEEFNNDPDATAFLKHKRAGGSTFDFFNTYGNANTLPDDLDLTQPANQKKVLEYYYLNIERVDEEDLEEKLEFVTEKGKTEVYAKKYYKDINDKDRADKIALATAQESQIETTKKNAETLRVDLQKVLDTGEGVGAFKFTSEEKKTLLPYITKPSVKIGPNKFITPFQAKLGEVMKDKKKLLTLAKILMPDFDLPDLKKSVTTTVAKEVKSKLQDSKNTGRTNRSTSVVEKSLADFFKE